MAQVESYQIIFEQSVTDRVKKLYDDARDAYPSVCVERARYFTESWKETEGEHVAVRRAKAIARVLEKMSIYILDGELIVGNVSSNPRASVVCPEYVTTVMRKEFNDPEKAPFVRKYDHHNISDEVKKELLEEIFPYWEDKTIEQFVVADLDAETVRAGIPSLSDIPTIPPGTEIHLRHGAGHLNVDYAKMISKGSLAIILEAKSRRAALRSGETGKKAFCDAVVIVHEAFIKWAGRYSELALSLAFAEKDEARKQELLQISEICSRVPAHPARTMREALQAFWFTQVMLFGIEQDDTACSPGRMDQYLYPFYEADIETGRIIKEGAQELIELLFLKTSHMSILWDYSTACYYAGFSLTQTITVGGLKPDGADGTNDLTYMFLEAEKQVGLYQPELSARIHKNSPQEYLEKIAEVSRLGHGKPKIFVDEIMVPMLLSRGCTIEEARDGVIVGCVEPSPSRSQCGWTNAAQFNVAKCMELALNSGVCQITKKQIGPKTQDAMTFQSIDEVTRAFRQQVAYFVEKMAAVINSCVKNHGIYAPEVFTSSLVEGCLENSMDMTEGGAKHKSIGVNGVAVPDVGDSLAALEKLVFQEGRATIQQVVSATRNNFEGEEDLRLLLENKAPKYGNDDDFVDAFVTRVGQIWCDEVQKYKGPHGEAYFPGEFTVSANVPYGLNTGALPSGRKSEEPLANGGISASNGMDQLGPTALIRSVAKLDHIRASNGTLLNMRFSPSVLKEDRDLVKFANFLRAYAMMGGYHIQFNVVTSGLLKKAQKKPKGYRNLLVRVAGYSAYFTELSTEVQNDLINRTVHEEVG